MPEVKSVCAVIDSTSKRLAELKEEMAKLRDEDRKYWEAIGRYHPAAVVQHQNRITRMQQVLEQIAKLKL